MGQSGVDDVDRFRAGWASEVPEIDTEPMGVFGRMRRISARTSAPIELLFARHGIDRGEFDVLGTLRRSGPPYCLTPTELYRSLMITSGGLTHRLSRLEKAGLIQRSPSRSDRRSLLVRLTDAGAVLAEVAFAEDMALEAAWLSILTPGERDELANLLRKLNSALQDSEPDRAFVN